MPLTYAGTSRFIDVNSLTYHYHEAGSGPPLVCVPATAIGATAWGQNMNNIEALSKHFRTLLVNLPPHGESGKNTPAYNGPRTAFYANELCDFMDALGIQRCDLYGGSPGAAVALRFALLYPERVRRIVMDAPTQLGQSIFVPSPMEGPKANQRMAANPTLEQVRATFHVQMSDPKYVTEELVHLRHEAMNRPGYTEALARLQGPPEDLRWELDKVTQPALCIFGAAERDVALDRFMEALWRMPNCRVHIFGGAGHWPQHERAEEWNRLVIGFLTEP